MPAAKRHQEHPPYARGGHGEAQMHMPGLMGMPMPPNLPSNYPQPPPPQYTPLPTNLPSNLPVPMPNIPNNMFYPPHAMALPPPPHSTSAQFPNEWQGATTHPSGPNASAMMSQHFMLGDPSRHPMSLPQAFAHPLLSGMDYSPQMAAAYQGLLMSTLRSSSLSLPPNVLPSSTSNTATTAPSTASIAAPTSLPSTAPQSSPLLYRVHHPTTSNTPYFLPPECGMSASDFTVPLISSMNYSAVLNRAVSTAATGDVRINGQKESDLLSQHQRLEEPSSDTTNLMEKKYKNKTTDGNQQGRTSSSASSGVEASPADSLPSPLLAAASGNCPSSPTDKTTHDLPSPLLTSTSSGAPSSSTSSSLLVTEDEAWALFDELHIDDGYSLDPIHPSTSTSSYHQTPSDDSLNEVNVDVYYTLSPPIPSTTPQRLPTSPSSSPSLSSSSIPYITNASLAPNPLSVINHAYLYDRLTKSRSTLTQLTPTTHSSPIAPSPQTTSTSSLLSSSLPHLPTFPAFMDPNYTSSIQAEKEASALFILNQDTSSSTSSSTSTMDQSSLLPPPRYDSKRSGSITSSSSKRPRPSPSTIESAIDKTYISVDNPLSLSSLHAPSEPSHRDNIGGDDDEVVLRNANQIRESIHRLRVILKNSEIRAFAQDADASLTSSSDNNGSGDAGDEARSSLKEIGIAAPKLGDEDKGSASTTTATAAVAAGGGGGGGGGGASSSSSSSSSTAAEDPGRIGKGTYGQVYLAKDPQGNMVGFHLYLTLPHLCSIGLNYSTILGCILHSLLTVHIFSSFPPYFTAWLTDIFILYYALCYSG